MKKNLLRFLTLVLSGWSLCHLSAATYFAAPDGNQDGLTLQSPTSFDKGLKLISQPGDTLYLLNGQYDLGNTVIQNISGTSNNHIVIAGYEGSNRSGKYPVILDFRTTPYGTRGLQIKSTCQYLHIKNMTLRYSGKNNLYNEGSYCIFENLDIYGSGDTGCQMKKGGDNIIKNVDSHHNFDYKTMSGTTANFGGNADGFADKQFTGNGNHYIGCRAWANSDDGWDFFQRVSSSPTVIEYSVCYQNGPAYYNLKDFPRYEVDKEWFDSKIGTQMTDRYGNTITITMEKYPCQGNGNGFKMGGQYTDHQITVHHCLAVANAERGFDQNNNGGTMYLYNNSAYANTYNFGFTTAYGTNTLKNNISINSIKGDSYKSQNPVANDHNSWNNGFTCSAADFQSLDTTQILAPRQADGNLSKKSFMHLADGSALIDAGVDVGLSYMGDAPDLGCYETDGIIRPYVNCTTNNLNQWIAQGEAIIPIVFQWGGAATGLSYTALPDGISAYIDKAKQTLTLSGTPSMDGTLSIILTTISDLDNPSLSIIIHVKSAKAHHIAFVSTPGATEDKALLEYLRLNDSLLINVIDANSSGVDYSDYEVLILGSTPKSSAIGFAELKGYNKPMLLLKPWLLKPGVWEWGTAINTQDLSVAVTKAEHPVFRNLDITNGELQLFDQCNTNAVTAISEWTNTTGFELLATPVSNTTYTSIADIPAGTDCNGTILPQRMVMIGVSEYSLASITDNGKRLIENAIFYLLGIDIPTTIEETVDNKNSTIHTKFIHHGQLYIRMGSQVFDACGRPVVLLR